MSSSLPGARLRTTCFSSLVLLAGCFNYVQLRGPEEVASGDDVRILVAADGAAEPRRILELPEGVATIPGTVITRDSANLVLTLPVGERRAGFYSPTLAQTVHLPSADVLRIERRTLDVPRTIGFVGAVAAGSALIITSIMQALVTEPRDTPPPGSEENRIPAPVIRIPFGH